MSVQRMLFLLLSLQSVLPLHSLLQFPLHLQLLLLLQCLLDLVTEFLVFLLDLGQLRFPFCLQIWILQRQIRAH